MLKEENKSTLKAWVDYWPTYLILGVSLAFLIDRTGIVQTLSEKLTKKESE